MPVARCRQHASYMTSCFPIAGGAHAKSTVTVAEASEAVGERHLVRGDHTECSKIQITTRPVAGGRPVTCECDWTGGTGRSSQSSYRRPQS